MNECMNEMVRKKIISFTPHGLDEHKSIACEHVCPVYPVRHVQINPFGVLEHMPFTHGRVAQKSVSHRAPVNGTGHIHVYEFVSG